MKAIRIAGISLTLFVAVGLASFVLVLAQQPTLAAPDIVSTSQEDAVPRSPQATSIVVYTNTMPFVIPENGCVAFGESTIDVSENMYIHSIRVGVKVTHTNRGDIRINLLSPGAIPARLIDLSNSTWHNFNVLFDSKSYDPPESPPGNVDHDPNLPDYEYVWRPVDDLALFYQHDSQGTWALQFCDAYTNSQTGQLLQWTLELELGPAVADLSSSFKEAPIEAAISSTVAPTIIWYNVYLQNSGALTATGVHLSDVLPPDVAYISGSLTCGGGCTYDPQVPEILWDGNIAPFGLEQIHFEVQPLRYGAIENIAQVTTISGTYDIQAATMVFPKVYEYWNFEGNNGGFNGDYSWEHGTLPMDGIPMPPGGGPDMWATGFSADYDDSMVSTLSKVVDLSGVPTDATIFLRWWEYYRFAPNDVGEIRVNGTLLDSISGASGDQWVVHSVDLSAYAGQSNVTLNWQVVPDYDTQADKGWYIDDVSIHAEIPRTDIAVFKEGSVDPAVIGEPLIYTVTVQNLGTLTATYVVMDDSLPPEVRLNRITPMSGSPDCGEDPPGQVHCDYGDLFPGQAIAVVLDTTVLSDTAQPGDQIVNYAFARCAEDDVDSVNNYATVRTTLVDTPFTAPQVYSVTPGSAVIPLTGKLIRIDGENFTLGMSAYLDGYELNNVTRITSRRLEARVPQSIPPGTYDLEVVASNGESGWLLDAFTVLDSGAPDVQRVVPPRGLADVPVGVFVQGENFSPDTWVALYQGTVEIAQVESLIFVNQNLLRGVIPPNLPPGLYDLHVGDSRGETVLPDAYTVQDPGTFDDLFTLTRDDLWTKPPSVQQGEVITVGVNVHRLGGQVSLTDVTVDYYWDALTGGEFIGTSNIPVLAPQSVASTTLTHTVSLAPGMHTLYAVIDPQNLIPEADEGNNVISRSVQIRPPDPTFVPSQITTFTINSGAIATDRPQVRLDLSATPAPAYVLYLEYQYIQSANTWVRIARSDWLPYSVAGNDYLWRLQPVPGVHYIQAWVADWNGNISPQPALARINLMLPRAHLVEGEIHVYQSLLFPGDYLARLGLTTGIVDFFIWPPNEAVPLLVSRIDANYNEIPFTIPSDGVYQFEVEGIASADYYMDVFPSGPGQMRQLSPFAITAPNYRGRGTGLTATPGDNTGLPDAPTTHRIYLPAIFR